MEPIALLILTYYSKNPAIKAYLETQDPSYLFIYPLEISTEALYFYHKTFNKPYEDHLKEIPYEEYNKALLAIFTPEIWPQLKQYDLKIAKIEIPNDMLISLYFNETLHPYHMYKIALNLLNTAPTEVKYIVLMRYYLYSKFQFTKP